MGLDRLAFEFFPGPVGLASLCGSLALQWVSPRYDLQWVYVGLRWVYGGGFDLRWPFSGSGCVSCLLGRVYLTGWLWLPWVCVCEF